MGFVVLGMSMLTSDRVPGRAPVAVASEVREPTTGPRHLFISGHSLTEPPFAENLAAIAAAGGTPLIWHLQHRAGSSLKDRTGDAMQDGASYDGLLLAERHTLLESLILDDTIGQLVTLSKQARAANPRVRTYLFASWLNVDRMDDPSRWIAYERAAGPAWQCVARAAAEQGAGPIEVVPTGEAMAALVEGIVAGRVGVSLDEIFTDDVHLTDAGNYYTALISYRTLYGRLPDDVPVPNGLSAQVAHALQVAAESFAARPVTPPPGDCRSYVARQFAPVYFAYIRDTRWQELGWARARLRWLKYRALWPARVRSRMSGDPLAIS